MTSLCNNEVATAVRSNSTRCSTVIDKAAATMPPEYPNNQINSPTDHEDMFDDRAPQRCGLFLEALLF